MSSLVAEAFVRLRPDVSTFRAEATSGIKGSLAGIGLGGRGGSGLGGLGLGVGLARTSAGLLGIGSAATIGAIGLREVVVGAADLEQSLNELSVASDANGEQMAQMSELAKQLGADIRLPGVNASDSATAMLGLSKAGLSVKDTMGGARAALQLAKAGELDVAEAAELVGSALNTFQLEGTEAIHVVDLLAGASIAAQGDIGDMALALQQAGAVANQVGLEVEETVGLITLLGRRGLRGSDLGTSLKTFVLRLGSQEGDAAKFTKALGIEFDKTKSIGEQLPSIIDQYRAALSKLPPLLQQVALTQTFGTDAVRVASIIFDEGSEGLAKVQAEADRAGAAQQILDGKTRGLTGSVQGLGSQLQTLAQGIGQEVNPGIQKMTDFLSDATSAAVSLLDGLKGLNEHKVSDIGLPGFDKTPSDEDDLGRLQGPVDAVTGSINKSLEALHLYKPALHDIRTELAAAGKDIRTPDVIDKAELIRNAHAAGVAAGTELPRGAAEGIQNTADIAIASARAMLAQVVAEGKAAVQASIVSAQQNLSSLGERLAADAGTIIDASDVSNRVNQVQQTAAKAQAAGQARRQREAIADAKAELDQAIANAPIQREIKRLRDELDAENKRDDKGDVLRTLRDAKEELAQARRSVLVVGTLDASQRASNQKFLRPFVEEVQDAKGEVTKLNKEATIDRLQKRLDRQTDDIAENIERLRDSLRDAREALVQSQTSFATEGLVTSLRSAADEQKETVRRGIADTIQLFNDGMITLPELNRRLAKILGDNGVDYKNAGAKLGTAFLRGFEETLKGIGTQASDILAGPKDPGAGIRPKSVSPAEELQRSRDRIAEAQRSLDQALLKANETTASATSEIARILRGSRTTITSVAQESGRRGNSGTGPIP